MGNHKRAAIDRIGRHTSGSVRDWGGMNAALEDALADDEVRQTVSSTVRRAVPALDADDVAQGVFCDALETRTLPSNPLHIPFWLAGIARHHVANYFRHRPREVLGLAADVPTPPVMFESREALGHVFERVGRDAEAQKTLEWIVLEHDGVPLTTIARAEKLSPAAVRARVYRLRARLRRELAYLLVGLFVIAGAGAALREPSRLRPISGEPHAPTSSSWFEGNFEVTQLTPSDDLDPQLRAKIPSDVLGATLAVHGATLEIRTSARSVVWSLAVADERAGRLTATATDEAGRVQPVTVVQVGDGLRVESTTGPFRGSLALRRIGER
jgi:DNA-directed RNA polymerase specialized sigma24 family protein